MTEAVTEGRNTGSVCWRCVESVAWWQKYGYCCPCSISSALQLALILRTAMNQHHKHTLALKHMHTNLRGHDWVSQMDVVVCIYVSSSKVFFNHHSALIKTKLNRRLHRREIFKSLTQYSLKPSLYLNSTTVLNLGFLNINVDKKSQTSQLGDTFIIEQFKTA